MTKYILFIAAILAAALGAVALIVNAIAGLLLFVISAVLFSAGAIVETLQHIGDDISVSRQTLAAMMREKTKILPVVLLCVLCASSSALAECDDTIYNPCPSPATQFVAYHKTDGELPIVLGDEQGHQVLLKEYALPVYFGYPVRSYRIIGTLITHGVNQPSENSTRPEVLRSIVSAAKVHDAEAVIMVRLTTEERLKRSASGAPWIVAKAVAVRWRRPNDS